MARSEFAIPTPVPNERGMVQLQSVTDHFDKLMDALDILMPQPSRRKSIVVTKLQEAFLFAVQETYSQPVNQVDS